MIVNDLVWFCVSGLNADGTFVGYESLTDAERNGVSGCVVEVIGY